MKEKMRLLFYCNESVLTSSSKSRNIAETCKKWLIRPDFKCATVSRYNDLFFFEKEHRFPLYFSVRAFPAPLRAESRGAPGKRSTTTEQSHFQENSVFYASIEIGPKENSAKKARHVGKLMKGSLAKKKSWFSLRTTLSSASFFQSH